jgi:hypothetical protein
VISEPSVTTLVEIHSDLYIVAIKVNNQMVIIQVQVGKNIVEDVLLDGRASVNIITKNFITKLGLPKPRPIPYHLIMVD